VMKPSVILNNK